MELSYACILVLIQLLYLLLFWYHHVERGNWEPPNQAMTLCIHSGTVSYTLSCRVTLRVRSGVSVMLTC